MSAPEPFEIALARFEGKLDAWSLQQARHEDRLNAHSSKLDHIQREVTAVTTLVTSQQETQREARRSRPTWPTVTSAVVAAVMAVLFVAQQIYGG